MLKYYLRPGMAGWDKVNRFVNRHYKKPSYKYIYSDDIYHHFQKIIGGQGIRETIKICSNSTDWVMKEHHPLQPSMKGWNRIHKKLMGKRNCIIDYIYSNTDVIRHFFIHKEYTITNGWISRPKPEPFKNIIIQQDDFDPID